MSKLDTCSVDKIELKWLFVLWEVKYEKQVAYNSFVMRMRALPTMIQIGQPTGDGVAGPTFREMSTGWLCGQVEQKAAGP